MSVFRNDLVFFIKFGLIPIRTEQKSLRPGRRPPHLFTHGCKRHPLVCLDNQFIMDVGDNAAAPQRFHGIHEDVPRYCLDDVFQELWTVAFKPLPFFVPPTPIC